MTRLVECTSLPAKQVSNYTRARVLMKVSNRNQKRDENVIQLLLPCASFHFLVNRLISEGPRALVRNTFVQKWNFSDVNYFL